MKTNLTKILFITLTFVLATQASAMPVYLDSDNISVSIGSGTSSGTFNNTFNDGLSIDKVIDAPSSDAQEFHNQTTHIWYTASSVGGGLELDFDFGQSYDISTLHFWNYTSERFDVDNIDFTFFDSDMNLQGELSISPMLGSSSGISAQDIDLDAPLNVQFVTAFLSGSNRQVDFQNIGFTAEVSEVPAPPAVWLFGSALLAFAGIKRKKANLS
ncbi:MAG: PEP-CTERM sorting domain-containing protein [Alteromonadaceae bacterium]|nr:MAG: PEP-CTERM sorting domain-containing protein [Alteromonadaceae bacterium]